MIRSKEFYQEKIYIYEECTIEEDYQLLCTVEKELNRGIVNSEHLRKFNRPAILKMCLAEGKFDLFKKVISPFPYQDGDVTRYRYYVDAFSRGCLEYIQSLYSSFGEAYAAVNQQAKEEGRPLMRMEDISKEYVILPAYEKEEILALLFTLDREKIESMKIGDVLARQISGMGYPVCNEKDVIYYSELSTVYPNLDLFHKNIITTANDTEGCYDDSPSNNEAAIIINLDYESLDDANKEVASRLVEEGLARYQDKSFAYHEGRGVNLVVRCSTSDTIADTNKVFERILSRFHAQDMLYGRVSSDYIIQCMNQQVHCLSEEEYQTVYHILENDQTNQAIIDALEYFPYLSFYYDAQEDQFWLIPYYYQKHKVYLDNQNDLTSTGFGGKK